MATYPEGKFSFKIMQGDDWSAPITISTSVDGGVTKVPVDLTSSTVSFVVRPTYTTGNLVSATVTPSDLVNGEVVLSLTDTQTDTLPPGALVFQLTTTTAGITTTRGFGNFIVRPRIKSA